jgi:ATP/maltotriose-dependent transcriptional regulator MalT
MLTYRPAPVTISRSKIEPPSLSGQWVRRPHLEARLDRALARSLVVVAAPAGCGKTSTIVCWLQLRGLSPPGCRSTSVTGT